MATKSSTRTTKAAKPTRATPKTTTPKTTAAKPAVTPRKTPIVTTRPVSTPVAAPAAAKPDPKVIKAEPVVADSAKEDAAATPKVVRIDGAAPATDLKKRELVDAVVARSGIKKKDAKPVVESLLAVLGDALADGRELNLPPFGKLRINRTEEKPGYRVIVCKLRQNTTPAPVKEPLAEPAE